MSRLLDFLSNTKTIVACFILLIAIGTSFSFAPHLVGGALLDVQMNAADASSRLAEMSGAQKTNHIWITLLLDSLYPLAYGGFLAGLAARFAKPWRRISVVPAFVTIIADFIENAVQLVALTGSAHVLYFKNFITPIKFGGFMLATILALLLLIVAVIKWAQTKRQE